MVGCGARLVEAAVDWARERKVQSIHLRVTCGDTAAVRLHQRAGFQSFGHPERCDHAPFELAQPMRLDLWVRGA